MSVATTLGTYISNITIGGETEAAGPFSTRIDFNDGVTILTARNGFGKSLLFNVVAWCLGLEDWLGGKENQADSIFPDCAVKEFVDPLSGITHKIVSSFGEITLVRRHDSDSLRLRRPIIGANTSVVTASFDSGETLLHMHKNTMKDEATGFQRAFFAWLGLPVERVASRVGTTLSYVYLENLAPYFLIDQKQGWSTVAAMQVRKYGQQDIVAVCAEYLLGAATQIRRRTRLLVAEHRKQELSADGQRVATLANNVTLALAGVRVFSIGQTFAQRLAAWNEVGTIQELLRMKGFDIEFRIAELKRQASQIRDRLSAVEPVSNVDEHNLTLDDYLRTKGARSDLAEQADALERQALENRNLISEIDTQIATVKALLYFKETGIGFAPELSCPTCTQSVSPQLFGLDEQLEDAQRLTLDQLRRERKLLLDAGKQIDVDKAFAYSKLEEVDQQVRMLSNRVRAVTSAKTITGEQMAAHALNLANVERQVEKLETYARELDDLDAQVSTWVQEAKQVEEDSVGDDGDWKRRKQTLERILRESLVAVRHGAFIGNTTSSNVQLDVDYLPRVRGQRMERLGSASDRARLVVAYALSMLDASCALEGNHPGFCVFDEPLQQNPDQEKVDAMVDLWRTLSSARSDRQIIIFTWIASRQQIAELRSSGVGLLEFDGRLLRVNEA